MSAHDDAVRHARGLAGAVSLEHLRAWALTELEKEMGRRTTPERMAELREFVDQVTEALFSAQVAVLEGKRLQREGHSLRLRMLESGMAWTLVLEREHRPAFSKFFAELATRAERIRLPEER